MELKKLQLAQLRLLNEFVQACNKLGVNYFVCYGTALGVVRHSGFIPWDDDIDIGMLRSDYEKFRREAKNVLPHYLFLQNYDTENNYWLSHAKLRDSRTTFIEDGSKNYDWNHGIFIDIFPFDYVPENRIRRWIVQLRKKYYQNAISVCGHNGTFWKLPGWKNKMRAILACFVNYRYSNKAELAMRLDRFVASIAPSSLVCAYEDPFVYQMKWFCSVIDMPFENTMVKMIEGYHEMLRMMYGDYMTPPPLECQIPVHPAAVIDVERSYTDYIKNFVK